MRALGELNFEAAPLVEAAVDDGLRDPRCTHVVLDLTATQSIDADGLRTLLRLSARGRDRGNRLRLILPQPQSQVARALTLTGARDSLPVVPY